MKKDIHPSNYREVVFKDMSNDEIFITRSTVELLTSFLHRQTETRGYRRPRRQVHEPLRQPQKEIRNLPFQYGRLFQESKRFLFCYLFFSKSKCGVFP